MVVQWLPGVVEERLVVELVLRRCPLLWRPACVLQRQTEGWGDDGGSAASIRR